MRCPPRSQVLWPTTQARRELECCWWAWFYSRPLPANQGPPHLFHHLPSSSGRPGSGPEHGRAERSLGVSPRAHLAANSGCSVEEDDELPLCSLGTVPSLSGRGMGQCHPLYSPEPPFTDKTWSLGPLGFHWDGLSPNHILNTAAFTLSLL